MSVKNMHSKSVLLRLISILIVFAVLCPLLFLNINADTNSYANSGDTYTPPENFPKIEDISNGYANITLATADDLYGLYECVLYGYYDSVNIKAVLTADINMNNYQYTFYGIASASSPFVGEFDGQNHKITFDGSLFGSIGNPDKSKTKICNLAIDGYTNLSSNNEDIGLLANQIVNATITNCHNFGSLNATNASLSIGGLVGYVGEECTIEKCSNWGNIAISGNANIGGIAGKVANNGILEQCFNTGNITGSISGGLVGETENICEINNSYNVGYIVGSYRSGGIVGNTVVTVKTQNVYNASAVKEGSGYVSSIVGDGNYVDHNIYSIDMLDVDAQITDTAKDVEALSSTFGKLSAWKTEYNLYPVLSFAVNNPIFTNEHDIYLYALPVYVMGNDVIYTNKTDYSWTLNNEVLLTNANNTRVVRIPSSKMPSNAAYKPKWGIMRHYKNVEYILPSGITQIQNATTGVIDEFIYTSGMVFYVENDIDLIYIEQEGV